VWLLLALVVVPALGRLHQVMHAKLPQGVQAGPIGRGGPTLQEAGHSPPPSSPRGTQASAPTQARGHDHGHQQALLGLLLADHAPVDCLLLDQLALGDALHSAPTALATPVPAQAGLAHPATRHGVRHVALYQARGPPAAG
jgi:hypothetical protein